MKNRITGKFKNVSVLLRSQDTVKHNFYSIVSYHDVKYKRIGICNSEFNFAIGVVFEI